MDATERLSDHSNVRSDLAALQLVYRVADTPFDVYKKSARTEKQV